MGHEITVVITAVNPERTDDIEAALNVGIGSFELEWLTTDPDMIGRARAPLGHENTEDLARTIHQIVVRANGGPCRIEVSVAELKIVSEKCFQFDESGVVTIDG